MRSVETCAKSLQMDNAWFFLAGEPDEYVCLSSSWPIGFFAQISFKEF